MLTIADLSSTVKRKSTGLNVSVYGSVDAATIRLMTTSRHEMILSMFGKRLRQARERKYRSAQTFAHRLGLEPHTYRKYERGETEPNFETLTRICEDLEITPNDLFPAAAEAPFRQAASDA